MSLIGLSHLELQSLRLKVRTSTIRSIDVMLLDLLMIGQRNNACIASVWLTLVPACVIER